VLVTLRTSGGHERLDVVQRDGAHGPTEREYFERGAVPQPREREPGPLSEQVVERDVDPGLRNGLPGRECGCDGMVHHRVHALDVRRVPTDQLRCEVPDDGHRGGLERLLAPFRNRYALPPAHGAAIVGDAHEHGGTSCRRAVRSLEELEASCHRVTDRKHVDAGDARSS
jgi:hypothetical protein